MRWWGIAASEIARRRWLAGPAVVLAIAAAPAREASGETKPNEVVFDREAAPAAQAPRPPQHIGYGALPGGLHVATAESLPRGTVGFALLSGYGMRNHLLDSEHKLTRAIGDLAVAYAPIANLSLALSLDGRYDQHQNLPSPAPEPEDDGYVGDPHLLVRYAAPLGKVDKLRLGGQLGVWVPGKDAPSVAASAISFDARALLSIDAGFGTLSANAGFRIDNSASSIEKSNQLGVGDQTSLGLSDFHAALLGAAVRVPLGARAYVQVEGSADLFVGDGAPGPILRGAGLFGIAVSDAVSVIAAVEAARVPKPVRAEIMAGDLALVPYEPSVTGLIGLQARFGGGPARVPREIITERPTPTPIAVTELAEVSGLVVDDAGKPVVGAKVKIALRSHTGETATDERGAYTIARLPIGKTVEGKTELDDTTAELTVSVDNKKPATTTLTLARGNNAVPKLTLDPLLPPGQLRAVVTSVGTSKPVVGATVTIEPGGITRTTGPDGKVTVDLPPGRYKLTVTAKGLAQQQLDVNIEQNGVAIENIDLHR